ncbi:Hypothetical_protein [Hexamita inflata]|uniref:Hypothetical_protein n=1 Tax=Hexamita inflata TaxID=28002 RepID=A0ABP1GGN7_9EUKA
MQWNEQLIFQMNTPKPLQPKTFSFRRKPTKILPIIPTRGRRSFLDKQWHQLASYFPFIPAFRYQNFKLIQMNLKFTRETQNHRLKHIVLYLLCQTVQCYSSFQISISKNYSATAQIDHKDWKPLFEAYQRTSACQTAQYSSIV